jgi:exosortase/archaeosortase family protein
VSAIPVAILVNVIRVSLIVAAFYYFDFDLTSEAVHTYLGIGVFILALIIIFVEKGILGHWDQSAGKK